MSCGLWPIEFVIAVVPQKRNFLSFIGMDPRNHNRHCAAKTNATTSAF